MADLTVDVAGIRFRNPILPAIGMFILGRGVLAAWRAHKLRGRAAT